MIFLTGPSLPWNHTEIQQKYPPLHPLRNIARLLLKTRFGVFLPRCRTHLFPKKGGDGWSFSFPLGIPFWHRRPLEVFSLGSKVYFLPRGWPEAPKRSFFFLPFWHPSTLFDTPFSKSDPFSPFPPKGWFSPKRPFYHSVWGCHLRKKGGDGRIGLKVEG
jgi:hypothetical protein